MKQTFICIISNDSKCVVFLFITYLSYVGLNLKCWLSSPVIGITLNIA